MVCGTCYIAMVRITQPFMACVVQAFRYKYVASHAQGEPGNDRGYGIDGDGFQVPVAQQAMLMSLFSRSSVCFSVCLRHNAPQNTLNFLGSMPPDRPRVKACRPPMFSNSAHTFNPEINCNEGNKI